jgi:hypothetical protein
MHKNSHSKKHAPHRETKPAAKVEPTTAKDLPMTYDKKVITISISMGKGKEAKELIEQTKRRAKSLDLSVSQHARKLIRDDLEKANEESKG